MLPILERYDENTQKLIGELLFYSPVAKTLEIQEFSLLSEVELTGTIIECEMGYRSEFVSPKKMFLLLNFDKLYVPGFHRVSDVSPWGAGLNYTMMYQFPLYRK